MGNHALTLSHDRHISIDRAKELGIEVVQIEDDAELQEAILSVHHACIHTLGGTPTIKLTENHNGVAYVQQMQMQQVQVAGT